MLLGTARSTRSDAGCGCRVGSCGCVVACRSLVYFCCGAGQACAAHYTECVVAAVDPLQRVRAIAGALATAEGHTTVADPDLCLYRFSRPTPVQKCATFGVTLGLVLQGTKRVRI